MSRYGMTPSGSSPLDLHTIASRIEALERSVTAGTPVVHHQQQQFSRQQQQQQPPPPSFASQIKSQRTVPLQPHPQNRNPPGISQNFNSFSFATNQNPTSWSSQQLQESAQPLSAPLSATRKRNAAAAAAAATSAASTSTVAQHGSKKQLQQQIASQKSYLGSSQFSQQHHDTSSSSSSIQNSNNSNSSLVLSLQKENSDLRAQVESLQLQLRASATREQSLRQALLDLATTASNRNANNSNKATSSADVASIKNEANVIKSEFDVDSLFADDDDDDAGSNKREMKLEPRNRTASVMVKNAAPTRRERAPDNNRDDEDQQQQQQYAANNNNSSRTMMMLARSASLHDTRPNNNSNNNNTNISTNKRTASSSSSASTTVQYSTHPDGSTILSPPPKVAAAMRQAAQLAAADASNNRSVVGGVTPLHAGTQGSRYGAFPAPSSNHQQQQQQQQQQQHHNVNFTRNGPASETPPHNNHHLQTHLQHSSPAFWSRHHEHLTEKQFDVVASAVIGANVMANISSSSSNMQTQSHHRNQQQQQQQSRSLGGPLSAPPAHSNGLSRGTSPLPDDPKRGANIERHFTFSGFGSSDKDSFTRIIRQLGQRADVVECETDEPPPKHVTHVVVPDQPLSVKALCALVSGRWIVTPEYLFQSAKLGFWVREDGISKSQRCAEFPLRGRHVLLQIPVDSRSMRPDEVEKRMAMREALRAVVEYGEGFVVPEGAEKRYYRDLIQVSSGNDLRALCI